MSVEKILAERGNNYGDFNDCAKAQQAIKSAVHAGLKYGQLPDIMREALDMISHKLGRIVTGNPYHADSWQDVIGYAQLVLDRIEDGVGLKRGGGEEATPALLSGTAPEPFGGATLDLVRGFPRNHEQPPNRGDTGTFKVGEIEPSASQPPQGPGTPEPGDHHARQDDPFEDRETLHITKDDVGRLFKTRTGDTAQVITFRLDNNFPVVTQMGDNYTFFLTARGRQHWSLSEKFDHTWDLVERIEPVTR